MNSWGGVVVFTLLIGAFTLLALRILIDAARSRSVAEIFVGVFFLALSAEVLFYQVANEPGVGHGVCAAVSSAAMLCFIRVVFRPVERWAFVVSVALGLGIAAVFVVPQVMGVATPETRLAGSALRASALLWASIECALQYRLMRRRVRLDLADPVVADRFLLWAIWTGGAAMLPISGLVIRLLAQLGMAEDITLVRDSSPSTAIYGIFIACVLAASAVSLWLSFFPSLGYQKWVVSRMVSDSSSHV
jgi:hypothetical protein